MKTLTPVFLLSMISIACTGARSPVAVEDARDASVALVSDVNGELRVTCGGVWVDETRFVTAAHCVRNGSIGSVYSFSTFADLEDDRFVEMHGARLVHVDTGEDVAVLSTSWPPPHAHAWVPVADGQASSSVMLVSHAIGSPFGVVPAGIRKDHTIDFALDRGGSGSGVFDRAGLVGICIRRSTHGTKLAPSSVLRRALAAAPAIVPDLD